MKNNYTALKNLALKREGRTMRCSSYDQNGGNNDFVRIDRGESFFVANIQGAGCITHIWMTCSELLGVSNPVLSSKSIIKDVLGR